jgi:hypothetical protein
MSDKSISQRLILKSGQTAVFVNPPLGYLTSIGEIPAGVTVLQNPNRPMDFIQVFAANRKELEDQLPRLKTALKPTGSLWVTYYKGTSKAKTDINRDSINTYANSLGMQGVAMISIDDDWSALRLKFT